MRNMTKPFENRHKKKKKKKKRKKKRGLNGRVLKND